MALRHEDGVIAKTSIPLFPFGDMALYDSLKNMAVPCEVQMDHRFEMGGAVPGPLEFVQDLGPVVSVAFMLPGISCRTDPRGPLEEVHQESRIVRKTVEAIGLADKIGLDLCVFLQGRPRFRDVPETANVLQGQKFKGV